VELRQPLRIAIDRFGQELERDRLSELQVVGAVDLAHAPLADATDDAVTIVEDRARIEPSVVDVAGSAAPAGAGARRART
jgi:hypothetical protein